MSANSCQSNNVMPCAGLESGADVYLKSFSGLPPAFSSFLICFFFKISESGKWVGGYISPFMISYIFFVYS